MAQLEPISAKPVATLDEVARVAGVSRATVSRVVNGSPKVSPDVRRSVTPDISVPHIVGNDEDDVGALWTGGLRLAGDRDCQSGERNDHRHDCRAATHGTLLAGQMRLGSEDYRPPASFCARRMMS